MKAFLLVLLFTITSCVDVQSQVDKAEKICKKRKSVLVWFLFSYYDKGTSFECKDEFSGVILYKPLPVDEVIRK